MKIKYEIGERPHKNSMLKFLHDLPPLPSKNGKRRMAIYKCDCGNKVTKRVSHAKSKKERSCGCLQNKRHGFSGTGLYYTYRSMLDRCNNPKNKNYKNYGGRGIKVCKRWESFQNFYIDMGQKKKDEQIDRINTNKGYSKNNCRWVTRKINQQNTRKSKWWFINYVLYESCAEAAKANKVSTSTIERWCYGCKYPNGRVNKNRKGCYTERKY